MNRLKSLTLFM